MISCIAAWTCINTWFEIELWKPLTKTFLKWIIYNLLRSYNTKNVCMKRNLNFSVKPTFQNINKWSNISFSKFFFLVVPTWYYVILFQVLFWTLVLWLFFFNLRIIIIFFNQLILYHNLYLSTFYSESFF